MLDHAVTLLASQKEEEAVQVVEVDGAGLAAQEGGDQEEVAMEDMTKESGTVPQEGIGKDMERVDGQLETSPLGTTIATQAHRGGST